MRCDAMRYRQQQYTLYAIRYTVYAINYTLYGIRYTVYTLYGVLVLLPNPLSFPHATETSNRNQSTKLAAIFQMANRVVEAENHTSERKERRKND